MVVNEPIVKTYLLSDVLPNEILSLDTMQIIAS